MKKTKKMETPARFGTSGQKGSVAPDNTIRTASQPKTVYPTSNKRGGKKK